MKKTTEAKTHSETQAVSKSCKKVFTNDSLSLPYEPFHQQGAVKVNERENKM